MIRVPGEQNVVTDETIAPAFYPCWKVPLTFQKDLQEELERMESARVIRNIREPTDWINSLVVVKEEKWESKCVLRPVRFE